ncbi:hypothetical protein AgCh_035909 [Apium graveolens]
MPVPSGKEKASSKSKRRVEKGNDVTVRRAMLSIVNNAQKAVDGVKSPPTSLKPGARHPSPPLPLPPPLPVDLTKLERVPNNQGIELCTPDGDFGDRDRIKNKPPNIPLEQLMVILKYWSDQAVQDKAEKYTKPEKGKPRSGISPIMLMKRHQRLILKLMDLTSYWEEVGE